MADRNIPTRRGEKSYLSRTKHQKNGSGNYAKWVSQNIEIETFDNADTLPIWECDSHLWGFIKRDNDIITVGTKKEQFGFFPATRNITDDWHGYPVFPFKEKNNKYDICKELLILWEENEDLTADEIATLIKGKLL